CYIVYNNFEYKTIIEIYWNNFTDDKYVIIINYIELNVKKIYNYLRLFCRKMTEITTGDKL
ncbi:MAG: hypothetical protein IJD80_07055, partial [Oscillospiraceae bacterium]|nr:hypothetical protein [Oscillospiraceae bacterium]